MSMVATYGLQWPTLFVCREIVLISACKFVFKIYEVQLFSYLTWGFSSKITPKFAWETTELKMNNDKLPMQVQ